MRVKVLIAQSSVQTKLRAESVRVLQHYERLARQLRFRRRPAHRDRIIAEGKAKRRLTRKDAVRAYAMRHRFAVQSPWWLRVRPRERQVRL